MFYFRMGILALVLTATGCVSDRSTENKVHVDSIDNASEQGKVEIPSIESASPDTLDVPPTPAVVKDTLKNYSNKRFKDVVVEREGSKKFRISGKGQIFEAGFGWYIEDGHNELRSGFAMTDAGAPEWGRFSFVIDSVAKKRPNSTLHLVLYETSAKDGSKQYELPILLY